MPLESRESLLAGELTLPPLFTQVKLREAGDAFAHAMSIAAADGAGTLVHTGRFDLAEFAVVLEPETPLRDARLALYAGMAALVDALAAHAQPETSITVDWPDSILVNMGLVGGGRLGWPQDAKEDAVPPWLVFGAMIRTAAMSGTEPGVSPFTTALAEEGFGDLLAGQLVESFARHFMVYLDSWSEHDFKTVERSYLERLPRAQDIHRHIDDNGDLLLRDQGKTEVERKALLPRLAQPAWLDPATKAPWG